MEKNIKTSGASIIEVLITMLIIALLLMSMVTVFPRMTAHRKSIKEADNARMLAIEVLERLQEISRSSDNQGISPSDHPIGCKRPSPINVFPSGKAAAILLNEKYKNPNMIDGVKYNVDYTMVCASPFSTVTITVTWKLTSTGKDRSISVTGVI